MKYPYLTLGALVLLAALAVSPFIPKLVAAQTVILPISGDCSSYNTYNYQYANCNPGTLRVYVSVVSNSTQYTLTRMPADFVITANAQNVSRSFPGSSVGTTLALAGQYSVTAALVPGYTPTYTTNCSGSLTRGDDQSCFITETLTSPYFQNPYQYGYGYSAYPYNYPQSLQCSPSNQTVSLGQTATFSVVGNAGGPFNWSTSNQYYQGAGSILSKAFTTTGTQVVTVSNGAQTSSCTVTVVNGVLPSSYNYTTPTNVIYPNTYPNYPVAVAAAAPATLYINSAPPTLPNTGFAPIRSGQLALLFVILAALGIAVTPYVRKTLAIIG